MSNSEPSAAALRAAKDLLNRVPRRGRYWRDEVTERVACLYDELITARTRLEKYGEHTAHCGVWTKGVLVGTCDCGLDEARAVLREQDEVYVIEKYRPPEDPEKEKEKFLGPQDRNG